MTEITMGDRVVVADLVTTTIEAGIEITTEDGTVTTDETIGTIEADETMDMT